VRLTIDNYTYTTRNQHKSVKTVEDELANLISSPVSSEGSQIVGASGPWRKRFVEKIRFKPGIEN